ncbi:MAG: hypothetical protein V2A69_15895 [Pseudomonadota bacterium]
MRVNILVLWLLIFLYCQPQPNYQTTANIDSTPRGLVVVPSPFETEEMFIEAVRYSTGECKLCGRYIKTGYDYKMQPYINVIQHIDEFHGKETTKRIQKEARKERKVKEEEEVKRQLGN